MAIRDWNKLQVDHHKINKDQRTHLTKKDQIKNDAKTASKLKQKMLHKADQNKQGRLIGAKKGDLKTGLAQAERSTSKGEFKNHQATQHHLADQVRSKAEEYTSQLSGNKNKLPQLNKESSSKLNPTDVLTDSGKSNSPQIQKKISQAHTTQKPAPKQAAHVTAEVVKKGAPQTKKADKAIAQKEETPHSKQASAKGGSGQKVAQAQASIAGGHSTSQEKSDTQIRRGEEKKSAKKSDKKNGTEKSVVTSGVYSSPVSSELSSVLSGGMGSSTTTDSEEEWIVDNVFRKESPYEKEVGGTIINENAEGVEAAMAEVWHGKETLENNVVQRVVSRLEEINEAIRQELSHDLKGIIRTHSLEELHSAAQLAGYQPDQVDEMMQTMRSHRRLASSPNPRAKGGAIV